MLSRWSILRRPFPSVRCIHRSAVNSESLKIQLPPDEALTTTNQHISVGPDGKEVVDLEFVEEPLGMPATEGYGWPQLDAG